MGFQESCREGVRPAWRGCPPAGWWQESARPPPPPQATMLVTLTSTGSVHVPAPCQALLCVTSFIPQNSPLSCVISVRWRDRGSEREGPGPEA